MMVVSVSLVVDAVNSQVFESVVLRIPKFPFLVVLKIENVLPLFCIDLQLETSILCLNPEDEKVFAI